MIKPTLEEARLAYRMAVHSRAVSQRLVELATLGRLGFALWGPGEEVHGTAAAIAVHREARRDRVALALHYRSMALAQTWCELGGRHDFTRVLLRIQLDIQGWAVERWPGLRTRVVGGGDVPITPASRPLQRHAAVCADHVCRAVRDVIGTAGDR